MPQRHADAPGLVLVLVTNPAEQSMQAVELLLPVTLAYLPALHPMHAVALDEPEYVPAVHG